jgi:outer membrane receptor protein involved in Fe transport
MPSTTRSRPLTRRRSVKEVFGEIQLPLLRDMTLAHALTLRANGRISDYKGRPEPPTPIRGEVMWKPIEDIGFRGSYARAVRAPNLADLYSEQGQNFAPGFGDPCSAVNLATGSANRVANCNAAGAPAEL